MSELLTHGFKRVKPSRLSRETLESLPLELRGLYSCTNGLVFSEKIDLEIVPFSKLEEISDDENFDLWRAWIAAFPFAWSSSRLSIVGLARFRGSPMLVHIDADDHVVRPICDTVQQFLDLARAELLLSQVDPRWPSSVVYAGRNTINQFNMECLEISLASRFPRSMAAFYFAFLAAIDGTCLRRIVASESEALIEAVLLEVRRRKIIPEDMLDMLAQLKTHPNTNIALDASLALAMSDN